MLKVSLDMVIVLQDMVNACPHEMVKALGT
jgi:hypothetical protein